MTWTTNDIKKYLRENRNKFRFMEGFELQKIKYITINYLDTKYEVQIKREN